MMVTCRRHFFFFLIKFDKPLTWLKCCYRWKHIVKFNKIFFLLILSKCPENIWAASWQNQQKYCAPSEDSVQPGHPPSLIRVFAIRMKKAWALSYPLSAQRRLWLDWADAQSELSLRWAHNHIVGFFMRRLICMYAATFLLCTDSLILFLHKGGHLTYSHYFWTCLDLLRGVNL